MQIDRRFRFTEVSDRSEMPIDSHKKSIPQYRIRVIRNLFQSERSFKVSNNRGGSCKPSAARFLLSRRFIRRALGTALLLTRMLRMLCRFIRGIECSNEATSVCDSFYGYLFMLRFTESAMDNLVSLMLDSEPSIRRHARQHVSELSKK